MQKAIGAQDGRPFDALRRQCLIGLGDAAVVATSTEHHLEVAGELLAAGVTKMVEKPISFRLEEVAKSLTTGRGKSYWFMLEPVKPGHYAKSRRLSRGNAWRLNLSESR